MSRVSTAWTKHLKDQKERKDFEAYVLNSRSLFDVLAKILDEEIDRLECPVPDYDNPSWAYKQADRHGALRSLNLIKKLIP